MNYSFKETQLGPNFRKLDCLKVYDLIERSVPFTIIGMPVGGISFFLKYLVTRNNFYFIHIDINELPDLSKSELFTLIAKELGIKKSSKSDNHLLTSCKAILFKLVKQHSREVIAFNRFDRLVNDFDQNLFANLRSLWEVDKEKIVMIFTANKPLVELAPQAVSGGNFNLCSKNFYLKPYVKDDLLKLIKMNNPNIVDSPKDFERAYNLSGGHYQLAIILLRSERLKSNPFEDSAVRFQIKELYDYLNYQQRKQLQKLAFNKNLSTVDPFLINLGYLTCARSGKYQIFSPLFEEYIHKNSRLTLPPKETKLFQLLKSKLGQIVSKDEIFNIIWENEMDLASDWALNALIYRLRKNNAFIKSGYSIESNKKIGYTLIRT